MAEFPQSRTEEILYATINGEEYTGLPESRIEELLLELKEVIEEGGGGGGGTSNYNLLENLPLINGITLKGDKSLADLGIIAEIKKAMDMITGYFDNTADYSAGDIVVYDKKLYKFTVDHTAGDWNNLEVSQTTVEELLSGKVDKVSGKGLSSNDYTNTDKAIVDGVASKSNLKLASSGTTASGEIRFGVDGNGNYGYIKAGADSVTPFKNPTGNKAIGTITQNGAVTGIDVEDYATASLDIAVPSNPNLQNKSVNPLIDSQSITKDSGYDGLGTVTVNGALGGGKVFLNTERADQWWSNSTTTVTDIFTVNKGANALPNAVYSNPTSGGAIKITAKKRCFFRFNYATEYNSPYDSNTYNVNIEVLVNGVTVAKKKIYNKANYSVLYGIGGDFEQGDTLELKSDLISTDKIHTYIQMAEGLYPN